MKRSSSTPIEVPDAQRDAVATAALVLIRRALVEGVPVTRARLAREASVALGAPPEAALAEVDIVAARLGVSGLR
jgi:hypothetical protein